MKKLLTEIAAGMCIAALLCGCGGSASSGASTETAAETETTAASEDSVSYAEQLNAQAYAYEFDLEKYVTLGTYKGLNYTITDTSVSEEDVDTDVQTVLRSYATAEQLTDRAVADGDSVSIDFVGKKDGVAFDGGTSEGYILTIGSNSFIDGFETGLIGAMPGETVTLDLTFPEDYQSEDLAGQAVTFDVTVNYIEGEEIIPEFTDEFVAGLAIDGVTTTDDYREYVRGNIQKENDTAAEQVKTEELMTALEDSTTINAYPDELLSQYFDEYKNYYTENAAYYGMELEEFLESYGGYFGTSASNEEELDQEAEDYSKSYAGSVMIICAVAAAEGYDVEQDYAEGLDDFAANYGFESGQELIDMYGEKYIKYVMINEFVLGVIEDNAVGVPAAETETEAGASAE